MRWVKYTVLAVMATVALGATTGCKKGKIVLRDPETYKNELYLFEMVIEQDTALLAEHIADGSCSCDEDGNWNSETCENSAINVVAMQARLKWHIAAMMYLGNQTEENPGPEPEIPDPATLCPSGE